MSQTLTISESLQPQTSGKLRRGWGLEGGKRRKRSLKNRRKAADPLETEGGSNDEGAQGEPGRHSTSSPLEFPDRRTLPASVSTSSNHCPDKGGVTGKEPLPANRYYPGPRLVPPPCSRSRSTSKHLKNTAGEFQSDRRTIPSSVTVTKSDAVGTLRPVHHLHVTALNVKVSRSQGGAGGTASP